jgi:hypothetical protein
MGKNYLLNGRQVDVQITSIVEDGFRVSPCVDKDAVAVRFDKSSETPLADADTVAYEHRGKDGDLEGMNLLMGFFGTRRVEATKQQDEKHDWQNSAAAILPFI